MTVKYAIKRLEETLQRQQEEEGEIATTPTVGYCFDCDKIVVDDWHPDGCLEHYTVSSDGYEHGGVQAAYTALQYIHQSELDL